MLVKILLTFSLLLALPSMTLAEVVGHLTQVEGRVELLKGGKLPAVVAKPQDGLEPGDVLRTKSLSRAQITFLDNTTVTLSPESRFAVEEYSFDAAKGKRSAVMQLFQGLAHFAVSQVFKVQEPDFVVKTHTAIMGVRGTEVGIRLSPNDTTFLNFHGLVRVGNIFPEVGASFKKPEKIAFSFGNTFVDLKDMQGSVVGRDLPPSLPFTISDEDRKFFMRQLGIGPQGRTTGGTSEGAPGGLADNLPPAVSPAVINRVESILNNLTIPPRLVVVQQQSPTESFSFSQTFTNPGSFSFATGPLMNTAIFSGTIDVSRTVAYPGSFTAVFNNLTTSIISGLPSTGDYGNFMVTANSITVSGQRGGVLTGTMTLNGDAVGSQTSTFFTLTGPVFIAPTGGLDFRPGGTFTMITYAGSTSGTIVAGNWLQTIITAPPPPNPGVSQLKAAIIPASVTPDPSPILRKTLGSH